MTRERSLLLRFAANRPTQATSIDDTTVELAVVRDGHVGPGHRPTARPTDALAACARRAPRAPPRPPRPPAPGGFPGFARPRRRRRRTTATTRPPPRSTRSPAARALAEAFAVAEGGGLEAHGIWTAAEEQRAVRRRRRRLAVDRTTDAFMKVICLAPGGRSGYAAPGERGRRATSTPGALAERAAAQGGVPGAAGGARRRASTPVVMEPHAVGMLLELLGEAAFNGLAHAEGRGALVGPARARGWPRRP